MKKINKGRKNNLRLTFTSSKSRKNPKKDIDVDKQREDFPDDEIEKLKSITVDENYASSITIFDTDGKNTRIQMNFPNGRPYMECGCEQCYDFPRFTKEGRKEVKEKISKQLKDEYGVDHIFEHEKGLYGVIIIGQNP